MNGESVEREKESATQIALGSFIAQASFGATAISAQQLIVILGGDTDDALRRELLKTLRGSLGDLTRTIVVDGEGNLIVEGSRRVPVANVALRRALAAVAEQGPRIPIQLPLDTPSFADRAKELATLDELANASRSGRKVCIHGMGGVGKSALAAHFAHTRQSLFPDGILWADLRVQEIAATLDIFAWNYGIDLSSVKDTYAKSEAVRAILSEKRALVVLDNAEQARNIGLLLSGHGRHLTLVTSRDSDLIELREASHLHLNTFEETDALEHIRRVLGSTFQEQELLEARKLGELCGYLPLALDISLRQALRARLGIAELVGLVKTTRSLTRFFAERGRSLEACFRLTWDSFSGDQRFLVYSIAIIDASSVDAAALAHMNNRGVEQLRYSLGDLLASSMVNITQSGRYRLHPLVRDFVLEQFKDDPTGRSKAFAHAAIDYYLGIVEEENELAESGNEGWERTRLELENFLAAWRWASDRSVPLITIRYVDALYPFLFRQGYWDTCDEYLRVAVGAAVAIGDKDEEISLRLRRGELARERGYYPLAGEELRRCIAFLEDSDKRATLARAIRELGELRRVERSYDDARGLHKKSLELNRELGDERGQARSLHDLGLVERILGNFDLGRELVEASLSISEVLKDESQQAYSILELGIGARFEGRESHAHRLLSRALERFNAMRDARGQAYAHRELGELAVTRRSYGLALEHHEQSLRLRLSLGDLRGQSISHHRLGYVHMCMGDIEKALASYRQGMEIAERLHDKLHVSLNLIRLGEIYETKGDLGSARSCWAEGVQGLEELGVADAEAEIGRSHLARTAPNAMRKSEN